jgi:hypothetical protein
MPVQAAKNGQFQRIAIATIARRSILGMITRDCPGSFSAHRLETFHAGDINARQHSKRWVTAVTVSMNMCLGNPSENRRSP